MRVVIAFTTPLIFAFGLFACDQLNRPMPVSTFGTSASSTGGPPAAAADGGAGDGGLPRLPPGDEPRVQPQPGDVQL